MFPWTIWNWKLALSGITSVEYAKRLFKVDKEDIISFGYQAEASDEEGEPKKDDDTHG